jgi:gamma-glutamylcyclotransferase (GGCT)/AIG2-like uncharacterized protein YtfP
MPKLFSYGTLQQEDVQLLTFGRRLPGVADALVGYRQAMVAIQDPEVVRASGKTHHPIVAFTGKSEDRVPGALFEISDAELAQADAYEVAAYVRIKAPLASGLEAWVYVDARGKPPPAWAVLGLMMNSAKSTLWLITATFMPRPSTSSS